MNNRYNFFAKARVDTFCRKDDYYPVLNNILFDGGKAVATNGCVLIVADVSEISNLKQCDIDKLNGHQINSKMYREILKYDNIKVTDEGIECVKHENTQDEIRVVYKFKSKQDQSKFVNYKNIIESESKNALSSKEFKTSFSCESIKKVIGVFGASYMDLKFTSNSNGVIIKFDGMNDTYILIKQKESECNFD